MGEEVKQIDGLTEVGSSISIIISDLIKDEWEAVDGYNNALVTVANLTEDAELLKKYGAEQLKSVIDSAVSVLTDIKDEELTHIGQLQSLLDVFSASTDNIEKGQTEGEEQIAQKTISDDEQSIADNEVTDAELETEVSDEEETEEDDKLDKELENLVTECLKLPEFKNYWKSK